MRIWDADKVRRVLEGKAVVRVVDVDFDEKMSRFERERDLASLSSGLDALALSGVEKVKECGGGVKREDCVQVAKEAAGVFAHLRK